MNSLRHKRTHITFESIYDSHIRHAAVNIKLTAALVANARFAQPCIMASYYPHHTDDCGL
jgi:hypothetical protein